MAFNGAAFRLPMGIYINANKPIDLKYGPYLGTSTEEGHAFHVDSPVYQEGVRYKGLTIGILINGTVTEYWWDNGLTNNDLTLKSSGVGSGTVESVNTILPNENGDITLLKEHINLGNVDNTADINKIVSTPQQAAIDAAIALTVRLQGPWDAFSNTPDISGALTTGFAWRVTTAGSTDLGGISVWALGDLAVKTDLGWMKIASADIATIWGNIGGDIANQPDLVAALATKENSLNNPAIDGYVLSSLADGTRMWIPVSSDGIYVSAMDPNTTTPEDHGGIAVGTTAGDLTGQSISTLIDMILFPSIQAYISQDKTFGISLGSAPSIVEVGTDIEITTTGIFIRGTIKDGDGTTNVNPLVGEATNYTLLLNGVDDISNATAIFVKNIIIAHGLNSFSARATYDAGTGQYFDNKGNAGVNLDPQRVAGNHVAITKSVKGRYKFWYGFDTVVVDSDDVRSLQSDYLDTINNGEFTITLEPSTLKTTFAVIFGSNVLVQYVESAFADVTSTFSITTISVDDAGGNPVSYDVYESILPSGYGVDANYKITISQ